MKKFKKNISFLCILGMLVGFVSGCQVKTVDREAGSSVTRQIHRQDLTYLENKLRTQKEKDQYSRILQWFEDDDERREFLLIDTFEDRQAWIQDNKMWERSQSIAEDYKKVMESKDIALGMPMELVQRSWGEPDSKEQSGLAWYKNERWKYAEFKSTSAGYKQIKKTVYFERGKVIGWETE